MKIFIKKAVINGNTLHKPGAELSVPEDIAEDRAKALIKGGFAVDAAVKAPTAEKEAAVVASIETAKKTPEVIKAVESVEKPTPGILSAAESKIKSFSARLPRRKPGSRMAE
jgi:hypothetical protein